KGFFHPYEYVYDEYYNCVICPNNQVLTYTTTNKKATVNSRVTRAICKDCPYLSKCTNSKNYQKVVTKHIWEDYIYRSFRTTRPVTTEPHVRLQ
ncbi:MAG: transposase, partial [Syntrophomonadaceae bacterium]